MRKFMLSLILASATGFLSAQAPATTWQNNLTWATPASCLATTSVPTPAPCGYAAYKSSAVNGVCGNAWTFQAPASGVTAMAGATTVSGATSWTDSAVVAGQGYCYLFQTIQNGANSTPSNIVTLTIPTGPTPIVVSGTTVVVTITVTTK